MKGALKIPDDHRHSDECQRLPYPASLKNTPDDTVLLGAGGKVVPER